MSNIDVFSRYQKTLKLIDLYPTIEGVCCCGCGQELKGRQKRWASKECTIEPLTNYFIIKGNTSVIRRHLKLRDNGVCSYCRNHTEDWEADHITPVSKGGAACGLDGFQTLCKECHKVKTKKDLYTN